VLSDRALKFPCEDDQAIYSAIVPHLESWTDIAVSLGGEAIRIEGVGFAAIGRLGLLQIPRARARPVGADPAYRRGLANLDELDEAELIAGADGANSLFCSTFAAEFGTTSVARTYLDCLRRRSTSDVRSVCWLGSIIRMFDRKPAVGGVVCSPRFCRSRGAAPQSAGVEIDALRACGLKEFLDS
jgi:hypothetical protein